MLEGIHLTYQDRITYSDALSMQRKLSCEGKVGFLFFTPSPVVTIGIRGSAKDIQIEKEVFKNKNIQILKVSRGGQVTYHGPGQVLIFPFGNLRKHSGDSRAVRVWIDSLQNKLTKYFQSTRSDVNLVYNDPLTGSTGVWMKCENEFKKIASIGMRFEEEGIEHGIALNLCPSTTLDGFSHITACGNNVIKAGSIFEMALDELEFDRQVSKLIKVFLEE